MYEHAINKETARKTHETAAKADVDRKKVGLLSKLMTGKDVNKDKRTYG